jgi:primase-polymerase (primpol)-like protein
VQGDLHHLPAALAPLLALPHWVCWRWGKTKAKNGEEKWTKVPFQPNGWNAKNNDPTTWSSYEAVTAVVDKFDGIGFCLLNGNIAAFDIDHCRDASTGDIDPWAAHLVEQTGSYSEITVSGTGLRIIGYGEGERLQRKLPVHDGVSLEAYRRTERYIVITGNPLPGSKDIINIDERLDATVAELEAKRAQAKDSEPHTKDHGRSDTAHEDARDKLERIIRLGENGEFGGDRSNAVLYVACEMLRRGSPETAIVSTLLDPANKISEHVRAQDKRNRHEPPTWASRE